MPFGYTDNHAKISLDYKRSYPAYGIISYIMAVAGWKYPVCPAAAPLSSGIGIGQI